MSEFLRNSSTFVRQLFTKLSKALCSYCAHLVAQKLRGAYQSRSSPADFFLPISNSFPHFKFNVVDLNNIDDAGFVTIWWPIGVAYFLANSKPFHKSQLAGHHSVSAPTTSDQESPVFLTISPSTAVDVWFVLCQWHSWWVFVKRNRRCFYQTIQCPSKWRQRIWQIFFNTEKHSPCD